MHVSIARVRFNCEPVKEYVNHIYLSPQNTIIQNHAGKRNRVEMEFVIFSILRLANIRVFSTPGFTSVSHDLNHSE